MPPLVNQAGQAGEVATKERRAHPRYTVSATAEAVELHSDTRILGRVSDIGRGGCYMEVMSPFGMGSKLRIGITKDEQFFSANATVLYSTGGMGMGLKFTEIEPVQLSVLERWLAELSGELPPEPKGPKKEDLQVHSEASPDHAVRYVLNELIIVLIRKRLLTDDEGQALLQKLLQ
jgi:PilZ domain